MELRTPDQALLGCLREVGCVLREAGGLGARLLRVAEAVRRGLYRSDPAWVAIRLGSRELRSPATGDSPRRLEVPLHSGETSIGALEVGYPAGRSDLPEPGPGGGEVEAVVLEAVAYQVALAVRASRAEVELDDRKEQLELAIGGLQGGIWSLRFDPEQPGGMPDRCYISDSLKKLIGFEPDELGDSRVAWWSRVHPEDVGGLEAAVEGYFAGGSDTHDVEYRIRHRDESFRWLHSRGRVRRDEAGRPTQWTGLDWDVTAAREADQARRRSEEKYARLFDTSRALIFLSRLSDGRVVEANRGFLETLGFSRAGVIGRTIDEIGLFADAGHRWQTRVQLLRRGQLQEEITLNGANGKQIVVHVCADRVTIDGEECALAVGQDITERIVLEDRLHKLAFLDPLTELPNRASAERRLAEVVEASEAREDGDLVGVLFIDLDRFKVINDSLGHRAGDQLLDQVAGRLRGCLRESDFLARFGGDEFLVVLDDLTSPEAAVQAAERLQAGLVEPFEVAGSQVHQDASIGVAVADRGGSSVEELLRYADVAMYRAKRSDRKSVELFQRSVSAPEIRRLQEENELWAALELGQLEVYYQPVVDLEKHTVQGAEALVRWLHPQRGLLMPAEFIRLAEETGLIVPMGEWVLTEAVRQVCQWRRQGGVSQAFELSVNLSARQLESPDFVERVERLLAVSGFPPSQLLLEITENVLFRSTLRARDLRALGVRLAIDDFGTGYASLAYLRQMIVDTLKIDRSFTRDLGTDPTCLRLVRSIFLLAESLDLTVVVEGIERPDQEDMISRLGSCLAQGFLYSPPLPADEFLRQAVPCAA